MGVGGCAVVGPGRPGAERKEKLRRISGGFGREYAMKVTWSKTYIPRYFYNTTMWWRFGKGSSHRDSGGQERTMKNAEESIWQNYRKT